MSDDPLYFDPAGRPIRYEAWEARRYYFRMAAIVRERGRGDVGMVRISTEYVGINIGNWSPPRIYNTTLISDATAADDADDPGDAYTCSSNARRGHAKTIERVCRTFRDPVVTEIDSAGNEF